MGNEHNMDTAKLTLRDKLMAIILLETSKDYKEMDSDLVTECVDFLMELEGKERLTKKEIEQRVKEIPFKGKVIAINSYAKKKMRAKRLAVIAAVLAVLITLFGIASVASGKTFSEMFRKMGESIYELLDGKTIEYENITFIKPNETKEYSSIEEFVKDEGIEILYPTWLPKNEKIVKVFYIYEENLERYVLQCNIPTHSVSIEVNSDLAEEMKLNCKEEEFAGYLLYYIETTQYIQANFTYKNNVYIVKSDTKDNLFKIIENLKEIN